MRLRACSFGCEVSLDPDLIQAAFPGRRAGAEAIVGSANLNDRSLLGDRDAEVSVAVKGPFVKAKAESGFSFSSLRMT